MERLLEHVHAQLKTLQSSILTDHKVVSSTINILCRANNCVTARRAVRDGEENAQCAHDAKLDLSKVTWLR